MRKLVFSLATILFTAASALAQTAPDPAACSSESNAPADAQIKSCSAIIDAAKDTPQAIAAALVNRAAALEKTNQRSRAVADLGRAIDLDGNNARAFRTRGDIGFRSGEYDRAILDYNQAIKLAPEVAAAFEGRGNAFNNKRDFDRAIEDYNEAIRLDPKFAQAFSDRGAAYYFKNNFPRAIADFDESIRLDPSNAHTFTNRGAALKKIGKNDQALADESEAIRLDPTIPELFDNRGLSYAYNGDYDKAIADYNEAIRLRPEAKFLTNRGDSFQFKKEYDHAIADYNDALKLDPRFILAYNNRAVAYRVKRDFDRAISDMEQVVRLNPKNDAAAANLSDLRKERERLANISARPGPSFDCATAKAAAEKAICSDDDLARLDRDINTAYRVSLDKLGKKQAEALRRDQRSFIATRNRLFGQPDYQFRKEMERRLAQLQTSR